MFREREIERERARNFDKTTQKTPIQVWKKIDFEFETFSPSIQRELSSSTQKATLTTETRKFC